MTQWTRSAAQTNVDALVKVGDYYYHGLGVSEEDEKTRMEKAARYYQSAADTQLSALAMWNLGWMYENGIGVTQVRNSLCPLAFRQLICYPHRRISILPNDTMIQHWIQTLRHIYQFCFRLLNCMPVVYGTL